MSVNDTSRIASVVLDVDSTLCGLEGIDWLAQQLGDDAAKLVSALTDRAMHGEIPLDSVYGERLSLVRPDRTAISELSLAYVASLAPGAKQAVMRMRDAGVRIVLVSGGLREAILPVAELLGVPEHDVHAVGVQFTSTGGYAEYDVSSPLATAQGKRYVVESLALPKRVLAVGDGATDLAMKPVVDLFAAFTGFVQRDAVVAGADMVFNSFDQLADFVLS